MLEEDRADAKYGVLTGVGGDCGRQLCRPYEGGGDGLFRPLRGHLPLKGKAERTPIMACLRRNAECADANYGVPTGEG